MVRLKAVCKKHTPKFFKISIPYGAIKFHNFFTNIQHFFRLTKFFFTFFANIFFTAKTLRFSIPLNPTVNHYYKPFVLKHYFSFVFLVKLPILFIK